MSDQIPADRLHLDDLHVGQRFTSASHTIDEAQIKAFASQFDPQPFHTDEEAAKGTFFKGLAASGWHTAAITMRLNVEGGLPLAGGIIGAGGEITWPAPTRPGDTLHVESRTAVLRSSSVERSTSVTKSSRHSPPNWSFRADSSKVRPNVVEPGHVRTDLNNNTGFIKPEEGALTAIKMAMIGGDGPTGGFFGSHVRQPW